MTTLPMKLLLPAVLSCLLFSAGIAAQPAPAKAKMSLAQAERLAVDLKQGMTLQEVEKLLGKPKRTALKTPGNGGATESWHNFLHWTYAWPGPSQSDWSLHVVFANGKAPEGWLVQSWDWTGY
jgi:hypothetical protein